MLRLLVYAQALRFVNNNKTTENRHLWVKYQTACKDTLVLSIYAPSMLPYILYFLPPDDWQPYQKCMSWCVLYVLGLNYILLKLRLWVLHISRTWNERLFSVLYLTYSKLFCKAWSLHQIFLVFLYFDHLRFKNPQVFQKHLVVNFQGITKNY